MSATEPGETSYVPSDVCVYEQYWLHARHVENQMWSDTRIWALVLTGLFTVIGSNLPRTAKASVALFGVVLSVLGFFLVYSLRLPFLAFALSSEAFAINELDLPRKYWRFFRSGSDSEAEKTLDMPHVLLLVYGFVSVLLLVVASGLYGETAVGVGVGGLLGVVLFGLYSRVVSPKFEAEKDVGRAKVDSERS
ncbi:hypothetical protein ACFO0N_15380 [Halobium salinum]|uniref:Uncharacterized protein n=1 Tax=Halobium salinum TaxID=1364940 RepID=A0ABD5PEH1_9EURY|nr:hypothetical protein [Halobium salinum]